MASAAKTPPAANDGVVLNPSTVAREALRQLAELRLPPTPDNFAKAYHDLSTSGRASEVSGALAVLRDMADQLTDSAYDRPGAGAALHQALDVGDWRRARELVLRQCATRDPDAAQSWATLIRDLLYGWEQATPGMTRARKRAALEHVLTAFSASCDTLNLRLRNVLRTWSDQGRMAETPAASASACTLARCEGAEGVREQLLDTCRTLLVETLTSQITRELGYGPSIVREAQALAREIEAADTAARVDALAVSLRAFWSSIRVAGEEKWAIQQGLLRLMQLVTANVSDFVGDGSWMRGQVRALAALARGKVTLRAIADLERGLLDMAERQHVLKHSLDEAKHAMKQMVTTFIERLGELASNTDEYHGRLEQYSREIESAKDISQLSEVIVALVRDTRSVQGDLGRSREELVVARQTVEALQERTAQLESDLTTLSERLQEDHLTRILNRRGLTAVFAAEASRADRHKRPLSLAMVDLDNFKRINDSLGHQGGDAVLIHFTDIVRACLRTSDTVARYGGEEFVILLPETHVADAMAVMRRIQQQLAREPFSQGESRIAVTFSAGVAERVEGETQEALLDRADRALYIAKSEGKNRLVTP